jgi:hypothetical protein
MWGYNIMSLKTEIAESIFKDKSLTLSEKKELFEDLKLVSEEDLEQCIKPTVLSEGVGKAIGYGYTAVLGAYAAHILKNTFDRCEGQCKKAYKYHKDKKRYAMCIDLCNKKVSATIQKKYRDKYNKRFNPEMGVKY